MEQKKTIGFNINLSGEKRPLTDRSYAVIAEYIVKSESLDKKITTTKLRKIYGQIANLYTKIASEEDFVAFRGDLQYLKVKMAYEAGRENSVKEFLEATGLMKAIDELHSYEQFLLFCRYAESLVAYFKYYGGKD